MQPRVTRWFNDSVAIERGPLVFSYAIGEDWVKPRDQGLTADWQVFPTTPWNYALDLDPANPAASIRSTSDSLGPILSEARQFIARRVEEPASSPFTHNPPVTLEVKARKLPPGKPTTAQPTAPPEPGRIRSAARIPHPIPYAAAKLRITAFPQARGNMIPLPYLGRHRLHFSPRVTLDL